MNRNFRNTTNHTRNPTRPIVGPKQRSTNVKLIVKQEMLRQRVLKYVDAILGATSVTASGTTQALVNTPQGITQGERISDVVELVHVELTAMTMSAFNSDVVAHARFILYQWRENIGDITPTVALILETPTVNSCFSALNYENRLLYKVVWDRFFSLAGTSTVPTDKSDHLLHGLKFKNLIKRLQYRLASSSASTNTLCILYISDSAATPFPALTFNFRVFYYDA